MSQACLCGLISVPNRWCYLCPHLTRKDGRVEREACSSHLGGRAQGGNQLPECRVWATHHSRTASSPLSPNPQGTASAFFAPCTSSHLRHRPVTDLLWASRALGCPTRFSSWLLETGVTCLPYMPQDHRATPLSRCPKAASPASHACTPHLGKVLTSSPMSLISHLW